MGRVLSLAPALAAAWLICVASRPLTRILASLLLIGIITANVVACGSGGGGPKLGERIVPIGQSAPKGGGVYRIGEPYQLNGVWYQPNEDANYDRVGTASWYGELFHGRRTANGEIYDMERLSAASPTLPMPVYARVTNLENGRSIVVRVNDRGPYRGNRIIDLSRRSAEVLGYRNKGTARVRVQYLRKAPLNGDDSYERAHLASQSWARQYAMGGHTRTRDPVTVASIADSAMPGQEMPRPRTAITPLVAEDEDYAPSGPAPRPQRKNPASPVSPISVRTVVIQPPAPPPLAVPVTSGRGLRILAGSFKNKENADKARALLGGLGQVEIIPMTIGGDTFYRVRVGPFADQGEASSALARATQAGYTGARIITN